MYNLKNVSYKVNKIDWSFNNCSNLKKIKISVNLKKEEVNKDFHGHIFNAISKSGDLITSKNLECNIPFDGYLPQNWTRNKE